MRGYIRVRKPEHVEFGFSVPVPDLDLDGLVEFDVGRVESWAQRGEPLPRTLIGLTKGQLGGLWETAKPNVDYELMGVYLGHGAVLTSTRPKLKQE